MAFITSYYDNIVKVDFLNKFIYQNTLNIPKIQKIYLTFTFKKFDFITVLNSLIALELITLQKSTIAQERFRKIVIKTKKGRPVKCQITLRKNSMKFFIFRLWSDVFSKSKLLIKKKHQKTPSKIKTLTFKLQNFFTFPELKFQYSFFKNLSDLTVNIVTNAKKL